MPDAVTDKVDTESAMADFDILMPDGTGKVSISGTSCSQGRSLHLCIFSFCWDIIIKVYLLRVPEHQLGTFGHRAFAIVGPKTAWNSLPDQPGI